MRQDLFICAKDASPELEPVEGDSTLYRKELIYPGKFIKKNVDGSVEFTLPVDERMLDHWVATHKRLVAAGVEVPMPIEHTNDPEKRRGTVERIEKEFNPDRGTNSLYMYARFSDPETAKLARTAQVSLYAPVRFIDGTGNTYKSPIRHVALTDYPLIPKLGPWQTVKASFPLALSESGDVDITKDPETTMDLTVKDIADRLGVAYDGAATDEEILNLIEMAWNDDSDPLENDEELPADDEELPADDEELPVDGEEQDMPASVRASMTKTLVSTRRMALETAVEAGKITPVERDEMIKRYADPKRMAIALSHGDVDNDGFDHTLGLLSKRKGITFSERTPAQQLSVDNKSPMIRDAERRATTRK